MYASFASLVSRQEEVASATGPVTILLVVGYLLVFVALADPSRPLITILSMLPPFAPILMSVRIAAGVAPAWQILVAMTLTLVAIVALVWLAGRIDANAAMRRGARVPFRDAFRGQARRRRAVPGHSRRRRVARLVGSGTLGPDARAPCGRQGGRARAGEDQPDGSQRERTGRPRDAGCLRAR